MRRTLCERSLSRFIKAGWKYIDPSPYVEGWHTDAICEHLQAVTAGQIRRLIINVPPRHMKSIGVAVSWPAWTWAQPDAASYLSGPKVRFLFASYAHTLSKRDSVKCRSVIQSPWYQEHWGDRFQLKGDQNEKIKFENTAGGYRLATSVDGALTGEGGDIIVVDDPHNVVDAESDVMRQNALDWWDTAMSTRLNDPKLGAYVIIMQRVHEDDLTGHILSREHGWDHLCLPAKYEAGHIFPVRSSIGFKDPRTREGELLWAERFGPEEIAELALKLGPRASGQLQQRPSPEDGTFFRREWFKEWEAKPALRYYGSSDYAVTDGGGDYTVHRVWGIDAEGALYRVDGWRGQATSDVWIEEKLNLIDRYKPLAWFGEGGVIQKAIEPALKRRMRERKVFCRLEWLPSVSDKPTRARSFQAFAASGRVYLERGADLSEYLAFPAGKHDDEVDTASLIGRAIDQAHPAIANEIKRDKPRDRWDRAISRAERAEDSWRT